jgi:CubicO group peptidase (beta-lactamase class C family)
MREYIFQPLAMDRSSMLWQTRFESDYANGYDEYGRSLGPHRWKRADAAGSLQTTVSDYAKFVVAVLDGQRLSEKMHSELLHPQIAINSKHEFPSLENQPTDDNRKIKLSYGLGWGLYWSPAGEAFFKEGHDEGWRNYVVCFPEKKAGIVILTNSSNGEGIYQYLLEQLQHNTFTPIEWEGFTPYDKLPPRPPLKKHTAVQVEAKLLDSYLGRYGVASMPGEVLTVRRAGEHLSIQENDEASRELLADSPTTFYSTTSDDTYTFETGSDGKVTRIVLHTDGKDFALTPIK